MGPIAMSTMSSMSMMGMPFGGNTNSQFGFGFGGVGGNTKDTVTVKLSLEGAARAQCMVHSALLGAWQKQMAVARGLPMDQHPQWDPNTNIFWPTGQGPFAQQQQQMQPLCSHLEWISKPCPTTMACKSLPLKMVWGMATMMGKTSMSLTMLTTRLWQL